MVANPSRRDNLGAFLDLELPEFLLEGKGQLKKISRCRLCNKKGHWAEDCHLMKKPTGGPVRFTYTVGTVDP